MPLSLIGAAPQEQRPCRKLLPSCGSITKPRRPRTTTLGFSRTRKSSRLVVMAKRAPGPRVKFSEAISFVVSCETQAEIDRLWSALCAGGKESQCGWVRDKYGLWWQLVPPILLELLTGTDSARAARVTRAMLKMAKLDIAALK